MAELREQIQSGTKKFESEFLDLSKGICAETGERRQQAMDAQHRALIDKASTVFRYIPPLSVMTSSDSRMSLSSSFVLFRNGCDFSG